MKRDFLSFTDLSETDAAGLLETTRRLKAHRRPSKELEGKSLAMIFQKPSTRTSVSFAVAIYELGGLPVTLNAQDLQIRRGESMADTAQALSRYVAGIMIRANRHGDVEELARHAAIPVINGLSDKEHPCQVLGDLFTILERFKLKDPKDLKNVKVAYVGDGNNVAQSWMLAAGLLGMDLVLSCPEGYEPEKEFTKRAQALCAASGGHVALEKNPARAVSGARVVYTDVWTSMGKEEEREKRLDIFHPYQVNEKLMSQAQADAVLMHCLPAHRGEEVSASILEGPSSVIFDQAENRLHVQKAILLKFMGGKN